MSRISEQFKGLDMSFLIGAPLTAAAESSMQLARATAEFINTVGFDGDNNVRNVIFRFNKNEPDPDGNMSSQEVSVDVPLLAIVPIPNLQIDEVNVTFDMEVKTSDTSTSSLKASAETKASGGFLFAKASITGNVSTSSENIRKTDNSAKYHVSVMASNYGIPEGLARVLDMIAANVAPNLISSTPVDQAGNALTGSRRERNMKLRHLREDLPQLEAAETASRENFEIKFTELLREGDAMRNRINTRIEARLKDATDENVKTKLTAQAEENNKYWDDFRATIRNTVVANASNAKEEERGIAALRGNSIQEPVDKVGEDIAGINAPFLAATEAQRDVNKAGQAISANKVEYNNTLRNITPDEAAT
ncbi:MAG: DUF2589 domain-containing protein [Defluviitaleaceae bacterium]|nr:DUF2589 domain-containing protein [Defluviitaleaceae bacterium]MCL2274451.1 DUF2589 domain-containing protein [Defluviitaleaceae bacterium]